MLTPVSFIVSRTDFWISPLFLFNSCRYFERKWMVKSTAIPKATLKIITDEGFKWMPLKPIMPPVMARGIKLGTKAIRIIRKDLKRIAIMKEIIKKAMAMLTNKFFMR